MRRTFSNSPRGRRAKAKYFTTFYVTICLISAFAVLNLVTSLNVRYVQGQQYGVVQRRAVAEMDISRLARRDQECRSVHEHKDQCAFIKANCPDEEAGLLSYLSLYYCGLPQAQPIAFIILALWLALLFSTIGIAASDFFSINLSTIASILGMSESMAGVTFLAFGNGSPDVFSTFAAMSTHSGSLAVGELIGAAGFITAVVAGSMALVREFKVGKKSFVRDIGFFIVASSFSMTFLADGALYFWECCVMIGFYLFYVATVVIWHWFLQRRRRRRERNALARGHYVAPENVEIEVQEEDIDDEDGPAGEHRSLLPNGSAEDFSALERGRSPVFNLEGCSDEESDDDGDAGRLLAAEMSNSMRVTRRIGSRRNTLNPIRPSLVGALEFRSVLAALQKSKSAYSGPIHLRRYSDDPAVSSDHYPLPISETAVTSDYEESVVITGPEERNEPSRPSSTAPRTRAVSMNDATGVKHLDPAVFSIANIPEIGFVAATPTFPQHLTVPPREPPLGSTLRAEGSAIHSGAIPSSPTFSLSPPPSNGSSRDVSPVHGVVGQSTVERLEARNNGFRPLKTDYFRPHSRHLTQSPVESPRTKSPRRPQLIIPGSPDSSRGRNSPLLSPFPRYTDSPGLMTAQSSKPPSLHLPEAFLSPESSYIPEGLDNDTSRPIKWWPYSILPCPRMMLSTLFPTLSTWSEKSIWDKFLSVISTPSIFLLTVTLPVVEPESKDDEICDQPDIQDIPPPVRRRSTRQRLMPNSPYLEARMEPEWLQYRRATQDFGLARVIPTTPHGVHGHLNVADVAVSGANANRDSHLEPLAGKVDRSSQEVNNYNSKKDWNRWLVAVQIFTAPLFVMLIVWANSSDDQLTIRHLVQLILYSLLGSLIVFAILLLTTAAEKPPKYRFLFCFVGFVVSVAWISTIANEVVGVLKAFGVILGISDAILGLTIFAVGNSLGDLVADITVARLGFPVMALSACFGGPMLNILLGIGISGLYMTVKEGRHKHAKHPDRPVEYKPYKIEVSGTLMVSGITLLVTLVGLLIAVPLNKWVMSRRIGWGLIALWSVSTVINLVVEITGIWPDTAYPLRS